MQTFFQIVGAVVVCAGILYGIGFGITVLCRCRDKIILDRLNRKKVG